MLEILGKENKLGGLHSEKEIFDDLLNQIGFRKHKPKIAGLCSDFCLHFRFIQKEEKDLGQEATVTDEEIEACLVRADEIEKEIQYDRENKVEKKYLIYRKETLDKEMNILKG